MQEAVDKSASASLNLEPVKAICHHVGLREANVLLHNSHHLSAPMVSAMHMRTEVSVSTAQTALLEAANL